MNEPALTFERIVTASPAFDKRPQNPGDPNYGVGAMRMAFVLKGPHGAMQFQIGTDWYLPHVIAEWGSHPIRITDRVSAWGIDYHSPKPMYEDQPVCSDECEYVDGPCYFDGGIGWAEEHWLPGFIHGGTKWLWAELEKEYRHRFLDEAVIYDDQHDLGSIGASFYADCK